MKEIKFPLLTREDIELRIGQVSKDNTKASLLLYQDARCGMKYLDLVVGAGKWQKKYYEVRGLVICSLGIYDDETKQWVWKDDTGTAGSIEEEKSIISDAFKRCCVCWGLARELYTSPTIWVDIKSKYDKFFVSYISYNDNREIDKLEIVNEKNEVVFTYPKYLNKPKVSNNAVSGENKGTQQEEDLTTEKELVSLWASDKSKERIADYLQRAFGKSSVEELNNDEIKRLANACKKALAVRK